MKCPQCGRAMRVLETNQTAAGTTTRRRECSQGHRVTTKEVVDNSRALTQPRARGRVGATDDDTLYVAGWNSGLEMVSFKLTHDFVGKLEKDTLASFAVWIKQFKKKERL